MAFDTARHGHRTTLTLGTSTGFDDLELLSIDWSGVNRESIETTHIATTGTVAANKFGTKTFIPAGTSDPGEITFEFNFDPDTCDVPIDVASETISIAWTDGTDTATWAGNGFCTGFSTNTADEEVMTCTCTYKLTGNVTMTDDV